MTKGTPSFGKHNKILHVICKRCGNHSYNKKKKVCVKCGFGKSSKIKTFAWRWKTILGKKRKKK
ncbi:MAG: 50S ribosomal protein L37e [Candidatus Aenigmarchaeota archaeon ex4484_56]|nr:MAG: 50S ribosomal protein L37e [Candidatus Aenigmarchaeota archaeon ex4484_56]